MNTTWQTIRNTAFTLLVAGIAVLPASAQNTTIRRLNPPGAIYATAAGVNSTGIVVGTYGLPGKQLRGFAYVVNKNTYHTLMVPGAYYTIPLAVNDAQTIAGTFATPDGVTHGFFSVNGALPTQYDVPGFTGTVVQGINNAGDFSGTVGSNGDYQGFVSIGGTVTTFTVHGRPTDAYGINSSGSTVGFFINKALTAFHGYLRGPGGFITQIDAPGSLSTACTSINDAGVISGFYVDSLGTNHGFILSNGTFTTTQFDYIAQINNAGAYAGSTTDKSGHTFGILLQP